jgi:hypothetical protein
VFVDEGVAAAPTLSIPAGSPIHGLLTDFTPTLIGTTAAGAGTYTTQVGKYLRAGKKVYVFIDLEWTAHTGTGNMEVSGLPFNAARGGIPFVLNPHNLTATQQTGAQTQGANDRIQLLHVDGSTTIPMDTAGRVRISGEYYVA